MKYNLMNVFAQDSDVVPDELTSLKMGIKKRTGEKFAKATTADGKTYIKSLTRSGIESTGKVTIPAYNTREERDQIIYDLYKQGYTQADIADMLDISQGTVSNILKKRK